MPSDWTSTETVPLQSASETRTFSTLDIEQSLFYGPVRPTEEPVREIDTLFVGGELFVLDRGPGPTLWPAVTGEPGLVQWSGTEEAAANIV